MLNRGLRKNLVVGSILVALVASLAGCAQPGAKPEAKPEAKPASTPAPAAGKSPDAAQGSAVADSRKPAGKAVIAVSTIGSGLIDPHQIRTGVEIMWAKVFAEGLVTRDFQGKIAPKLAEKWQVSPDGKTVTFTLRKGVKFHNGMEVTAEDVKWSFDRVVSDEVQSARKAQIQAMYDGTEIIDPYQVVLRLKKTDVMIWDLLDLYMAILPKALYDGKPAAVVNEQPVGTGPWKYVSRQGNDIINVTAWEAHWSHVPYVKDLQFRTIPEAATRWAALKAGEVDIADLTGSPFVGEAKKDPTIQVNRNAAGAILDLHPGLETMQSQASATSADKPFLDPRVRLAMSMALDRKAIAANFYYGFASPAKSRIMPYSRGYRGEDRDPAYDPAKAKQLLAQAGYPNGFQTELHFAHAAGASSALAEFLQSNWRDIGVDVKLVREEASFVPDILAGKLHGMVLRQQAGLTLYEPGAGWSWMYTNSVFQPWEQLQKLTRQYAATLDEAQLSSTVEELRKLWLEDSASFPVIYLDWVYAMGPKVQEWPLIPGSMMIVMSTEHIKLKGQ